MVDIGKLNKRVTFLRFKADTDDMEQDKGGWKDHKTVWATVKPYKSSESSFMSKLKPSVTHRIYIRHRKDITADMRIRYHGRIFEISGPPLDMDERHEILEIQCEEVFEGNEYHL